MIRRACSKRIQQDWNSVRIKNRLRPRPNAQCYLNLFDPKNPQTFHAARFTAELVQKFHGEYATAIISAPELLRGFICIQQSNDSWEVARPFLLENLEIRLFGERLQSSRDQKYYEQVTSSSLVKIPCIDFLESCARRKAHYFGMMNT